MREKYVQESRKYKLEDCVTRLEGMFADAIEYYNRIDRPKPVETQRSWTTIRNLFI